MTRHQPPGIPTGGQFASDGRARPTARLGKRSPHNHLGYWDGVAGKPETYADEYSPEQTDDYSDGYGEGKRLRGRGDDDARRLGLPQTPVAGARTAPPLAGDIWLREGWQAHGFDQGEAGIHTAAGLSAAEADAARAAAADGA